MQIFTDDEIDRGSVARSAERQTGCQVADNVLQGVGANRRRANLRLGNCFCSSGSIIAMDCLYRTNLQVPRTFIADNLQPIRVFPVQGGNQLDIDIDKGDLG